MNRFHQLRQKASASYTQKILTHGPIPQGVDWSGEESQRIRFEQLCKVIVATEDRPFSILDYGCGYGALIGFLRQRYKQFDYTSFDISEEMIREARNIYLDLTVKRKCYILVGGITARLWAMGVYDSDEKVLNSISGQRRRVPIILCWFCEIFRRISKVVLYL